MADLIDMTGPDTDVIRILRPSSVLQLLHGLCHVRSSRLKPGDSGAIVTDVAPLDLLEHCADHEHGAVGS